MIFFIINFEITFIFVSIKLLYDMFSIVIFKINRYIFTVIGSTSMSLEFVCK